MNFESLNSTALAGRRNFVKRCALAATGVAVAAVASPALAVSPALRFADIPGQGDVKVLNFALALEDLEANLYSQALARLTTGGRSSVGATIPGLNLPASAADVDVIRDFGEVEREHRNFLRSAIEGAGATAISRFNYDFGMQNRSRKSVIQLVYIAEKTGVSAYLGAIPYLKTRTYIQTAGAIQGTEARHTAIIADVINELFDDGLDVAPRSNNNNGIDAALSPDMVLASVSPFIVV